MNKLDSLKAFAKVVQHGSFAEAARDLRLSRSAVSKYVGELERELGVQLLVRTTRRVSATENGRAYFERVNAILADLEEADLAVSRLQSEPRGILRINGPMSFGTLHLGRAVAEFMSRYPELKVVLTLTDALVDPVQEGYDVTVRIADLPSSSLIARKLAPASAVICASPSYLQQHGVPQHPDDLRRHRCLSYSQVMTTDTWKLTGPDGEHRIPVPWVMCANNGEVLRDAAVAGQGIAVLPTFMACADIQVGRLQTVLSNYKPADLSIYAIYAPTKHLSNKVRLFIDFLVERFGRVDWDKAMPAAA